LLKCSRAQARWSNMRATTILEPSAKQRDKITEVFTSAKGYPAQEEQEEHGYWRVRDLVGEQPVRGFPHVAARCIATKLPGEIVSGTRINTKWLKLAGELGFLLIEEPGQTPFLKRCHIDGNWLKRIQQDLEPDRESSPEKWARRPMTKDMQVSSICFEPEKEESPGKVRTYGNRQAETTQSQQVSGSERWRGRDAETDSQVSTPTLQAVQGRGRPRSEEEHWARAPQGRAIDDRVHEMWQHVGISTPSGLLAQARHFFFEGEAPAPEEDVLLRGSRQCRFCDAMAAPRQIMEEPPGDVKASSKKVEVMSEEALCACPKAYYKHNKRTVVVGELGVIAEAMVPTNDRVSDVWTQSHKDASLSVLALVAHVLCSTSLWKKDSPDDRTLQADSKSVGKKGESSKGKRKVGQKTRTAQ